MSKNTKFDKIRRSSFSKVSLGSNLPRKAPPVIDLTTVAPLPLSAETPIGQKSTRILG